MQDISHWPFEVVEKDGSPMIKVNHGKVDKILSPQEISSMVLTKMKGISEAKLGKTVNKAVITCVKFVSLLSRMIDHLAKSVFLLTSTTHNVLLPRTPVPLLVLMFFVSSMSLLLLLSHMALIVSPRRKRMSSSLILEEELSMFRS